MHFKHFEGKKLIKTVHNNNYQHIEDVPEEYFFPSFQYLFLADRDIFINDFMDPFELWSTLLQEQQTEKREKVLEGKKDFRTGTEFKKLLQEQQEFDQMLQNE